METFVDTIHPVRTTQPAERVGTHDGTGAGDHDAPFQFGKKPHGEVPYPFTTRQYARLLILRSRIQANLTGADDKQDAHPVVFLPDGVWIASTADLLRNS